MGRKSHEASAEEVNAPAAAPAADADEEYDDLGPSVASNCVCTGAGLGSVTVRQEGRFFIEARDANGHRRRSGGDHFFVAIRGCGVRLRARVTDSGNGTYAVAFKPSLGGKYLIAISLYGESLPGSPFRCLAQAALPCAARCVVRGDALERAVARVQQAFEVSFRDGGGQLTHAEELDVYVEEVVEGASTAPAPSAAAQEALAESGLTHSALPGRLSEHGQLRVVTSGSTKPIWARECVANATLIVREGAQTDSSRKGQILTGRRLFVLEESPALHGVRARVAVEDEEMTPNGSPPRARSAPGGHNPMTRGGPAAGSGGIFGSISGGGGLSSSLSSSLSSNVDPSTPLGRALHALEEARNARAQVGSRYPAAGSSMRGLLGGRQVGMMMTEVIEGWQGLYALHRPPARLTRLLCVLASPRLCLTSTVHSPPHHPFPTTTSPPLCHHHLTTPLPPACSPTAAMSPSPHGRITTRRQQAAT